MVCARSWGVPVKPLTLRDPGLKMSGRFASLEKCGWVRSRRKFSYAMLLLGKKILILPSASTWFL